MQGQLTQQRFMNPMMFTDSAFLFLFLPFVITAYRVIPERLRNAFLLTASICYYGWGEGPRVWVLLASIGINYGCGLAIASGRRDTQRKARLVTGIVVNLALLGVFKYLGFLIDNVNHLVPALHLSPIPVPSITLPIGISFFTFMGLSYLADTYWKRMDAERNPATFALYLSLFPHLIAGPIVRFSDIADQLHSRVTPPEQTVAGIRRFIIGLGKKMLIGNTVAVAADSIFKLAPDQLTTSAAWLGILCYTLQIYFDFSGYSDMAIGLAAMFGFVFPENFNYPYIAKSVTEFWQRWHMSLSSWLRDYLFFPLGVRGPRVILYRNILIVFFLCGLWHGASWHFVAWGLFHGVFLVLERSGLTNFLNARAAPIRHAYTLAVVVTGWVLFRAENLTAAVSYYSALLDLNRAIPEAATAPRFLTADLVLALTVGVAASTPLLPFVKTQLVRLRASARLVGALEFAGTAALFIMSAALSAASTYNPFIYFRF